MNIIKFRVFWFAVAERATKTFAQTELALLAGSGTGLIVVDWQANLSVAGMATLLSVFTSLAGIKIGGNIGPSIGTETLVPGKHAGH